MKVLEVEVVVGVVVVGRQAAQAAPLELVPMPAHSSFDALAKGVAYACSPESSGRVRWFALVVDSCWLSRRVRSTLAGQKDGTGESWIVYQ